TRCVFIYATDENIQGIQNEYTVLSPQTVTALYQNQ
ncbi:MAG TPA: antitermination protein NusG, partial [Bacteroides clarus]|nr:antitermination protein NusG [Bacteroides clarus]